MAKSTKVTLTSLGIVVAAAALGWVQANYGVDLGLCPPSPPAISADAGAK